MVAEVAYEDDELPLMVAAVTAGDADDDEIGKAEARRRELESLWAFSAVQEVPRASAGQVLTLGWHQAG